MHKYSSNFKKGLTKLLLSLLVLSVLASAAAMLPVANAQEQSLMVSPSQGPAGSYASIIGMGFGSHVIVKFGSTQVASAYPAAYGRINTGFAIPSVSLGTYTVTATDESGGSASATFTVVAKTPTPAPSTIKTPTPQPSSSSSAAPSSSASPAYPTGGGWTYSYPTFHPSTTPVAAEMDWTPIIIVVVISVVLSVVLSSVFLISRRGGKRELPPEEEQPLYRQPEPYGSPYGAPARSGAASRYGQPPSYGGYGQSSSRPPVTPRYSQRYNQPSHYSGQYSRPAQGSLPPSRYGQRQPFMKVCPRCKRSIRDDYNICPYCDNKLR